MSVAFLRPFKRSNFTKKDQCIKYISTSFVISHTNVGFHFFISDLVIYKALLSGIYDLPELIDYVLKRKTITFGKYSMVTIVIKTRDILKTLNLLPQVYIF